MFLLADEVPWSEYSGQKSNCILLTEGLVGLPRG